MDITKSSRHQKVVGNFGENLVSNWLSRSGLEVALVDHTGIDVIVYDRAAKKRLGITVKSRTRNLGKEDVSVTILRQNDRELLEQACQSFGCEPWIAVYVETSTFADLYLTSLENYDKKYRGKEGTAADRWKMSKKHTDRYDEDPNVRHIRIEFRSTHWWEQ
jgi:hypothetical protein